MAQAEDTELRDLVIEALEKNGSLAKIRALLRANIFLAFEDERQNIKQNVSLDNVLNIPEGVLSLCIIHEFLEFCNLKNTLFVYVSESCQGKEYRFEGKNDLADKLNLSKLDKEPILVTLLKNVGKQYKKKYLSKDETSKSKKGKLNCRDDQNCTYIVHEDSNTTTSQSQSDNSSDEKNKLHLRLPLDTSDTDTSSDSARDKTSSEYIANKHILEAQSKTQAYCNQHENSDTKDTSQCNNKEIKVSANNFIEQKVASNSSSDSTSYLELKPFNPLDKLMLNTTGLPIIGETNEINATQSNTQPISNVELSSPVSISSASTGSPKSDILNDKNSNMNIKNTPLSPKLDAESVDYSYDFMPSSASSQKNMSYKQRSSQENIEDKIKKKPNQNSYIEHQKQNSHSPHSSPSSHSSISLSDVADLINESLRFQKHMKSNTRSDKSNSKSNSGGKHGFKDVSYNIIQSKHASDDSGDFSESPIPSLSNLSLDIHSD